MKESEKKIDVYGLELQSCRLTMTMICPAERCRHTLTEHPRTPAQ